MNLREFTALIEQYPAPTILLEGVRSLPAGEEVKLAEMGKLLAKRFPHARFRTGNAPGSDEAFAAGVAVVDSGRLEYVLPYSGHRKKNRYPGAFCVDLSCIGEYSHEMENLIAKTLDASPEHEDLLKKRRMIPRLKAKTNYLLRDTLKVVGLNGTLPKAAVGIFFADATDPMKGGTGHTIRVCRKNGVPVVLQNEWRRFLI